MSRAWTLLLLVACAGPPGTDDHDTRDTDAADTDAADTDADTDTDVPLDTDLGAFEPQCGSVGWCLLLSASRQGFLDCLTSGTPIDEPPAVTYQACLVAGIDDAPCAASCAWPDPAACLACLDGTCSGGWCAGGPCSDARNACWSGSPER